MNKKKARAQDPADLRKRPVCVRTRTGRAEEKFRADDAKTAKKLTPEKTRRVLHELRVHQIELEIQNEELRRTQAELDAARARYFDIFDLAPVGYCTISEKGLILETNVTAATLLGAARGTMVKQPLTRFILKEDREIYCLHRKQLFETGEPQACELRMVKKDGTPPVGRRNGVPAGVDSQGSVFWARLEATVAQDGIGGTAPVYRAVLSDISERKRVESQREAALEALRAKNDELERFTYSVAHDLKSPLVTIRTFLGILEQDMAAMDKEKVKQDLGYIRIGAEKMSRLLDELLDLSRIGRSPNPPEEVSLQSIVKEASGLVAGRITERGVKVVVADTEFRLWGDRVRLVEVFQNLLDNACKFMGEQKSPLIEIGMETKDDEAVIYVRDNGSGITPQFLPKLFIMFEKLNRGSEGDGIGLALVKRIVEVHGGRIWVEPEGPGQGACFKFTLAGAVRREA